MSLQKLRDVTGHTPRRFAMWVPLQNCIISFCCDFARAGVNDKPLASVSFIFPAASSACQVGLGRAEQAKEDLEEVPGFSARIWTKRKHVEMERVTMKYHEVPYG